MAKNRAIVIGINGYEFLPPLEYAKLDAKLMHDFLCNEASFEKIYFFSDDSPDVSGKPTRPYRANLLRVLRQLFETPFMEAGDNFWFFFSGHGMRHNDCDYLMPSDGDPGDIENTGIAINYITQRLRRCGADNVVLILDACRNQGTRGEGIGRQTEQMSRQTGVISIFSCSPNEYSYEIQALQQGAFTYVLLEGLGNSGQCATVERLNQYLSFHVPQLVSQHKNVRQTPYIIAEPVEKSHLILLSRYATLADIDPLKIDAYRAQDAGNLEQAQQLWVRVLAAASGPDSDAIQGIRRIAQLQGGNRQQTSNASLLVERGNGDKPSTFSSKSANLPQTHDLDSAEEVDYKRLRDLPTAGNGKQADASKETPGIMLKVAKWEKQGRCIYTFADHLDTVKCVTISPDGKTLASGSADKTIKIWNLNTGRLLHNLDGHSDTVNCVTISPDGKILASGSADKTIKIWNLNTGKLVRNLGSGFGAWFYSGHLDAIYSLAISPDGQTLISGSRNHTIDLWNLATGEKIDNLPEKSWGAYSLAITPDGQAIASDSLDTTIKLYKLGTNELLQSFTDHSNLIWAIAISPDAKTLASGSQDHTVKLWDLSTGKLLHTLTDHSNSVHSVAFSLDGQILASGSYDNTIKLWNVGNCKPICTLSEHRNGVNSVAFSPDGKTLASGSDDKTIKIWQG